MAFNNENLHVSGTYGYGPDRQVVEAKYFTADADTVVGAADYFNPAAARLPAGSQVDVSWGIGGTAGGSDYIVASNDGTTVAVTKKT